MTNDPNSPLRSSSRRLSNLVAAMLLLLLVYTLHGALEAREDAAGQPMALVLRAVFLLPAVFYFAAMAALYLTFRNIARGALLEPAIVKGMRRVGLAVAVSGIVGAVVVPAAAILILVRASKDGSISGSYNVGLHGADVMLILVGLAVFLLAHLLDLAVEYRALNQRLQSELEEFL